MKIDIKSLRKVVREILKEEMDEPARAPTMMAPTMHAKAAEQERPTIPASQSAAEKQFQKDTGGNKWGNPKAIPKSNANQKDERIWTTVTGMGVTNKMNDQQRQAYRQEFDNWMKTVDPSDKLIATADDMANRFVQSKKSAGQG